MSESLLQIASPILADAVRARLQAVYEQVPGVSCDGCDNPGKCCWLTEEEMADDYATMYPLYAIEYANIVDYVRAHFDADRQRALLDVVDERPQRCPFLTESGGCSIHPVRPLTCRTYGVLNEVAQVETVAASVKGKLSQHWISSFLSTERYTVCDLTVLKDAEKVDAHMQTMVAFGYERELIEMSDTVDWLDADRQVMFEKITGKKGPIRWTWGGFNALAQSSLSRVKKHFENVWKTSFLGE